MARPKGQAKTKTGFKHTDLSDNRKKLRDLHRKTDFIPDLSRYKHYSSAKGLYRPFDVIPDIADEYSKTDAGRALHLALFFLDLYLNIPIRLISTEFKQFCKEKLSQRLPKMRCSSIRAIFEGRVPGIPKPLVNDHPTRKKQIQELFYLCDIADTLVTDYLESIDGNLDALYGPGEGIKEISNDGGNDSSTGSGRDTGSSGLEVGV